MGSLGSLFAKKRQNMNLYHFGLFLLFVLAANGAPDPNPSPKAAPKPNPNPRAKAQMAIIFNGRDNKIEQRNRRIHNRGKLRSEMAWTGFIPRIQSSNSPYKE